MAKNFFKCYKKIYLFALTSTHSTVHFFNVILSRFLMTLFWQYSSIQFLLKMKIFSGHWIPATPRVILSLLRTNTVPGFAVIAVQEAFCGVCVWYRWSVVRETELFAVFTLGNNISHCRFEVRWTIREVWLRKCTIAKINKVYRCSSLM